MSGRSLEESSQTPPGYHPTARTIGIQIQKYQEMLQESQFGKCSTSQTLIQEKIEELSKWANVIGTGKNLTT